MNRPAAGLGAFASLVESTCSQRNMCGDVQQPTRELQKASAFARSLQIAPEHQVKRHLTGEFVKKYRPTEGCEMKTLKISTSRGPVRFNVWDTAGQDHLSGLRDGYFIGAQCAMVFFDVTNLQSHQNVSKWVTELRKVAGDIPVVVVGNKVDAGGRLVKAQEGSLLMRKLKVQYYDLSVRSHFNMEAPLLFMSRRLLGDRNLRLTPEAGARPPETALPPAADQRRAAMELAEALNVAIHDSDDDL
ncbi:RAN [Symbiodinium natans]|uniref:GTP-binding nuclear protein n=1 Tax=Symbiodinium natans TaxID=878477 RepID=A0A812JXM9_9DINO|nr:RAN [Symbiodinium natans]